VIYQDRDHGDWIYIASEGEVEILIKCERAASGHWCLKPVDIFDDIAYLDKETRSATAKKGPDCGWSNRSGFR